jgi:TPR repeat protein
MRLDYPNAFDQARAGQEGRARLGGDIMIHGKAVSDGCLPVGDIAVEELFALTARVGTDNVAVVVSPVDLRRVAPAVAVARAADRRPWLGDLYAAIADALTDFRLPADDGPVVTRRTVVGKPTCKAYDEADCVRRCGRGDLASCARAGLMYEDGRGVTADATKAWSYLQKACDGGDALGCAELSRLYVIDDGLRRDSARAVRLARAACDAGDGHGCAYLARLCIDRLVYPDSEARCDPEHERQLYERAVALLKKDCDGWGAYDCHTLATIYSGGDPRTALRFATGSCRAGDPGGCFELGRMRQDAGDPVPAHELYERACRAGYAPACERPGVVAASAITTR